MLALNDVEIYGLYSPDGELRYIGKANNAEQRFLGHLRERRRRTPLYDWIQSLRLDGKTPEMRILATCPADDWERAERQWIFEARLRGERLLNLAPGGDQPFASREILSRNAIGLNHAIANNPRRSMVRSVKQRLAHAIRQGGVSQDLRERIKDKARTCPQILGAAAALILSQEAQNEL